MRLAQPEAVAVVGLGYVGLPLATAFGRMLPTIAFDVSESRVAELVKGHDRNGDIGRHALETPLLRFTTEPADLADADVLIVTVPTPVDSGKRPDTSYLASASHTIGAALSLRRERRPEAAPAIVVYESTVYPGCTDEVCVPILEESSTLVRGVDFRVGYSPERINPGDAEHTLERVVKVVAGEDAETLDVLATLYERVVEAGVHRAPDIRTAEAAKVIENTQRDLNIALMNELALLFHELGLDSKAVFDAAATKWNILPFRPELVGGHCIPEDPYYLTYKAEQIGFHPQTILARRRVNDLMGRFVAQQTVELLIQAGRRVRGARVLVLGVSFKENVADTRNSRVLDLVRTLERFGVEAVVEDPVAGPERITAMGLRPHRGGDGGYDGVVLAVPHRPFVARTTAEILEPLADEGRNGVVVDVRRVLDPTAVEATGALYWAL